MGKFLRGIKRATLGSKRFISVVDFFETNLFKRELHSKNVGINLDSTTPTSPSIFEQEIFSETFGNDGTTPNPGVLPNVLGGTYYNPPLTWTTVSLDGVNGVYANRGNYNNLWTIVSNVDAVGSLGLGTSCDVDLPGCSGGFYLYMSDNANLQDYITLPVINTTGKTNIKLQFKSVALQGFVLDYSTNGTVWNTISALYTPSGNIAIGAVWLHDSISLPAGAANQATLYIRFKQPAGAGGANWLLFDDIKVLATF